MNASCILIESANVNDSNAIAPGDGAGDGAGTG